MKRIFYLLISLSLTSVSAQENNEVVEEEIIHPLKWNLNEKGTQSVTIGMWTHVWARSMEMNPGTQVNEVHQDRFNDFGLRRMRLTGTFQLNPRYKVFLQLGTNNQTFTSGGGTGTGADGAGKRAKVYFHDAYVEYTLKKYDSKAKVPFSLAIGSGLHAWNGVSRFTNASTNKMLTFDIPVYNFPGIEISDQMGRQFGVFAHGEIGRLAYRMHVNQPFATSNTPKSENVAIDNNGHNKYSFGGYYSYQFLDRDPQGTSFLAGTYLGEKSMFNVGFGFYNNNKGTATLQEDGSLKHHDINVLGVDVFYEKPFGTGKNKQLFSLYSVYYNYNFGPNYIRTQGLLNPGVKDDTYTGPIAAEGFGNTKYFFGTGSIWHSTVAYMFPKFKDSSTQLQPYVTYAWKDLDAMQTTSHFYDIGMNVLLKGHNAKITFQYASRPLHHAEDLSFMKRAGEWQTCFQIYF